MRKLLLSLALLWSCCAVCQEKYGIVNFSVNYMRLSPDYESPLETQELMGTVVKILDKDGYWLKVESPQPYVAWCTDKGIVPLTPSQMEEYAAAPKYIVLSETGKVYAEASENSCVICDIVMGDVLRIARKPGKKKHFAHVMLPDGREGYVPSGCVMEHEAWKASLKASPESLVACAKQFLGTPYLWGGMSPKGFDCSGLTRFCYMMNGILLPRNASQQVKCGVEVNPSPENLQPGDLLFFGNRETGRVRHVGMYIGDKRFIHSSHLVRINSMDRSEKDCYENIHRLLYVRRILP